MERRLSIGRIFLILLAVVLVGVFGFLLYNDGKLQNLQVMDFNNSQDENRQELNAHNQQIIQQADTVQQSIDNTITGLVLYGNTSLGSGKLSYQLKNTLNTELFKKINDTIKQTPSIIGHQVTLPVADLGISSETTDTILARLGITPLVVAKDFTIPADTAPVEIGIKTIMGTFPNFAAQADSNFSRISINGIEGRLKITQENNNEKIYFFVRKDAGEAVNIISGTRIIPEIAEIYQSYTPVIFFEFEQDDAAKYISTVKAVLKHHEKHNEQFIVIYRTKANSEMDVALSEAFGYNYIRTDEEEIDYADLAEKIYFRIKTLKYLDEIINTVQKAENVIFSE